MKMQSYKILEEDLQNKYYLLADLFEQVLLNDQLWHFFLDDNGITLRITLKFKKETENFFKKRPIEYKNTGEFDPSKQEYMGVRFIGDELQYVFHATSIMTLKFPPNVMTKQVLERVTHILINQQGIHDFKKEAQIYAELALGRARLDGKYNSTK